MGALKYTAPYAGKHPGDLKPPTEKQIAYYRYLVSLCKQQGIRVRDRETVTRHEYALAIGFMKNDLGILSQTEKAKARRESRAKRKLENLSVLAKRGSVS